MRQKSTTHSALVADSFTARFTRRLLRRLWPALLRQTAMSAGLDVRFCYVTEKAGEFRFQITLSEDSTPADVVITRETPSGGVTGKYLPNIQQSLASALQDFWHYAADKAECERLALSVRRYEEERGVTQD